MNAKAAIAMKNCALLTALATLAACGGQPVDDRDYGNPPGGSAPPITPADPVTVEPELLGTAWVLKTMVSNKGIPSSPPNTAHYQIEFHDDGRLSGQLDCNNMGSAYSVDAEPHSLTLGEIGSTKAACPGGHDAATSRFLNSLIQTERYRFEGGNLITVDSNGAKLVFEPRHPGCDEPLMVTADGGAVDVISVTTSSPADAADLITELETRRPDFVLLDAGGCSRSFGASVNANTLSMLRCRQDIESLSLYSQSE